MCDSLPLLQHQASCEPARTATRVHQLADNAPAEPWASFPGMQGLVQEVLQSLQDVVWQESSRPSETTRGTFKNALHFASEPVLDEPHDGQLEDVWSSSLKRPTSALFTSAVLSQQSALRVLQWRSFFAGSHGLQPLNLQRRSRLCLRTLCHIAMAIAQPARHAKA